MEGIAAWDVALALEARLEELSLGSTGNLRISQPVPFEASGRLSEAVFVYPAVGLGDERFLDGGLLTGLDGPAVTIRVRGSQADPQGALLLAARVYGAINRNPPDGYCLAIGTAGGPIPLGPDEDGHPEYMVSVTLKVEHRPRPIYFGPATPAAIDEAFVKALPANEKANFRFRTFTANVGAGDRLYYAFPSDRGSPTFLVNGSTAAFTLKDGSLALTHDLGADTYQVWESDAAGIGNVTVKVR